MIQKLNSIRWEKLHQNLAKHNIHTRYPHELLVRWVSIIKQPPESKVLDIGFGSGRNLEMLADKGYDTYGIEVSKTAINHALKINNKFKLSLFTPPKLNFPDNFFDLIISLQAIYYNINLEVIIEEIWRVLKEYGFIYISFYGKNHFWIKNYSNKISPTLIEWSNKHPAKTERGLKLRFFEKKSMLKKLFSKFSNIEVNTYTYDLFGNHYEYYFVIAQKITNSNKEVERNKVNKKFKEFYLKQ